MKLSTALDSAARITDPELVMYKANNGQYMVGRKGTPYLTEQVWEPSEFIRLFGKKTYRKPVPLVDMYPEAKPYLEHLRELHKKAHYAIFELEQQYPMDSYERDKAFRSRCELSYVEDHILRDLGIRGR